MLEGTIVMVAVVLCILFFALIVLSAVSNRKNKTIGTSGLHLWSDKKHTFLGLPLSFTRYTLDNERLFINRGMLVKTEDEVRLYRVLDISLREDIIQQILGLGSITVKTSDKSLGNFTIKNICHPRDVKELISQNVENQRKRNRVATREFMGYDDEESADSL